MPTAKSQGEVGELHRLLDLIIVCPSKQQLPSLEAETWKAGGSKVRRQQGSHHLSTEALSLEDFSKKYEGQRNYQSSENAAIFEQIFSALVKHRLCNDEWSARAPPENVLRVMIVMRMLMRDPSFQHKFVVNLSGLKQLCLALDDSTKKYLEEGETPFIDKILIEMTNIFQKLSSYSAEHRELIVHNGAHKSLVMLLSAGNVTLLHCALYALHDLAQSEKARSLIGELNCTEKIMRIFEDYDLDSKRNAAKLLKTLCGDSQVREMIKVYDGIPLLLSLLDGCDLKLLRNIVWCIVQLAEDVDTSDELRRSGVIPLLINLLQDRKYSNDTDITAPASATLGSRTNPLLSISSEDENHSSSTLSSEEMVEQVCLLKSACCAALTELIRNDHNSQQIVTHNGVYAISLLTLPDQKRYKATETLQKNALRTLRFLFSKEGNRRMFQRIFHKSHAIFTAFTAVGHYVHNIEKYQSVVDKLNHLPDSELSDLKESMESTNQQREITQYIEDYAVLEQLGSGAFGSVCKVRKKDSSQAFYALKEVNLAMIGKNNKDRDKSMGEIISEINIIRDQMKHPNIVKYYRTFTVDTNKLCIVMELIDGAPIAEHFHSLKEKGETFSEPRIWNIFIQIVLALRYLHKEKEIIHRDLTPNNIMLSENDKVTITDFGLAKRKRTDVQYMQSTVGTILYCCPEIVQDHPYGEKADVWAIGCILYQMCTLSPPFSTSNMLALASRIVAGTYEPLPDAVYSSKISDTIAKCLTVNPKDRPDIIGVAGFIAEELMYHLESIRHKQFTLEKKLEKEKKRTQKHSSKANDYMQSYQKLFIASQERYDKLANSQSSIAESPNNTLARRFLLDPNNNIGGGASGDDEDEPSSSDSSGSSASLRNGFSRPPKPPASAARRRKIDFNNNLEVEIPANNKYGARDSGCSSAGEPSPNHENRALAKASAQVFHRSLSSPVVDRRKRDRSESKGRPVSTSNGAATFSISPRKVKQISDPIQQILNVLHKVIYISQLPPSLTHNPCRTIVDKFKRALFLPNTSSAYLKTELKKLAISSTDLIDINFGNLDLQKASLTNPERSPTNGSAIDHESGLERDITHGISYDQLNSIIETVLMKSDYYSMQSTQQQRHLLQTPLAAIIGQSGVNRR